MEFASPTFPSTRARPCSSWPGSCRRERDRKSTRLNSSHSQISYAVFCLKKKKRLDLGLDEQVQSTTAALEAFQAVGDRHNGEYVLVASVRAGSGLGHNDLNIVHVVNLDH